MTIGECLASFCTFLGSRGITSSQARKLQGFLERRLLDSLGGPEAHIEDVPSARLRALVEGLLQVRHKDLSSALHHFAEHLALLGHGDLLPLFVVHAPLRETVQRLIGGIDPRDPLDAALGRYLAHLSEERRLSNTHILSSFHRLRSFLDFARDAGHRTPSTLHTTLLVRFRDEALARGVRTFVKDLSALRGFFRFLLLEGEVPEDPTVGLRTRVAARGPRRTLAPEELRSLLDAPRRELDHLALADATAPTVRRRRLLALRDDALLRLLAETGLRPVELLRLSLDDLDLARGRVLVRGKGSRAIPQRQRIAFLEAPDTLEALQHYIAARPHALHRTLFLNCRSAPLGKTALDGILLRRAREAAIRRRVFPSLLRTTFASRIVAHGADPFALRVLMGHDDIRTTFRLYTFLSLEELRDVWRSTNPLAPRDEHPGGAA